MQATQQELLLPKQREELPESVIYSCAGMLAAVNLMVNTSGLENKQIAPALNISEAHLSEILHGKKNFPLLMLDQLMEICQSEIPIIWWNNSRGYERPRLRRSQVEIQLESEKRKNAALVELLRSAMTGEMK